MTKMRNFLLPRTETHSSGWFKQKDKVIRGTDVSLNPRTECMPDSEGAKASNLKALRLKTGTRNFDGSPTGTLAGSWISHGAIRI